jgi:hypothetical protein
LQSNRCHAIASAVYGKKAQIVVQETGELLHVGVIADLPAVPLGEDEYLPLAPLDRVFHTLGIGHLGAVGRVGRADVVDELANLIVIRGVFGVAEKQRVNHA